MSLRAGCAGMIMYIDYIVPIGRWMRKYRQHIRTGIGRYYKIKGPLTFLHVSMLDDRSDFYEQLEVEVKVESDSSENLIIIRNANVVANTIAYVSIRLRAKNIILHLAEGKSPLLQGLRYFPFGTGEIGLLVYEILINYWKGKPEEEHPALFLMTA